MIAGLAVGMAGAVFCTFLLWIGNREVDWFLFLPRKVIFIFLGLSVYLATSSFILWLIRR